MSFDPRKLPLGVYTEYKKGPKFWPLVVKKAMDAAIFDVTKLTDIVFYLHHPERIGNPLKPFETKLINEWKAFRTTIAPWIQQRRSEHVRLFNGIEGTDVPGF